jgi:hypothetical protein
VPSTACTSSRGREHCLANVVEKASGTWRSLGSSLRSCAGRDLHLRLEVMSPLILSYATTAPEPKMVQVAGVEVAQKSPPSRRGYRSIWVTILACAVHWFVCLREVGTGFASRRNIICASALENVFSFAGPIGIVGVDGQQDATSFTGPS